MIERSAIMELRLVEPPKMEQLVTDREGAEDVGGSRGSSAPKPSKRAGTVATLAGGKREPDKSAAVAGLGGDDLAVLRFRFIKASELPQLVRRGQSGKPVLRIQRCGAAEELQRDRSLAP